LTSQVTAQQQQLAAFERRLSSAPQGNPQSRGFGDASRSRGRGGDRGRGRARGGGDDGALDPKGDQSRDF
jgi:hypothetical protein